MASRINKRDRALFLAELVEHGNTSKAAAVVGRSRSAIAELVKRDEAFAEEVHAAKALYLDALADNITTMTAEGVVTMIEERKKTGRGKDAKFEPVKQTVMRRPDVRGAIRILERRHPDFQPTSSVRFSGQSGVLVVPARVASMEELEKLYGTE